MALFDDYCGSGPSLLRIKAAGCRLLSPCEARVAKGVANMVRKIKAKAILRLNG